MKATKLMKTSPSVISFAAIGGKKENEGPLGDYFDKINDDPYLSTDSFEKGESQLQKQAVLHALDKAALSPEDIDVLFGGDLLNQCVGTTYGVRAFEMPFLGIYGACSTMAEGLLLASLFVDNDLAKKAMAVTSSHFCTAERQYRFPLNYGGQRTPTSQWTATASGSLVVAPSDKPPYIRGCTIGKIVDLGVSDANNMGAAMAPAAFSTISTFFTDTGMTPSDFDYIVTGDLGKVGSRILCELFERENINIRDNHKDCGMMLYDFDEQDIHAGGSGCGCAGSVLCGYFLPKLRAGEIKNILFAATGALMSPTVNQQGESIPSISHLVWLSGEIDDETLIEGAIKGYVSALGDPYTTYYTKEEMDELMEETTGNYVGIGIYMTLDLENNAIYVVKPMEGSPAEEAGIKAGDLITKVDGIEYSGEELDQASNAIKGKEGTKMK